MQDMQGNMGISNGQIISAPTVKCSKCGSKVFTEVVVLKKIPGLMVGSTHDELVPIPVYACNKCGEIPDEFLKLGNAKKILGDDNEEQQEEKKSSLIL